MKNTLAFLFTFIIIFFAADAVFPEVNAAGDTFTICYHADDKAAASNKVTVVTYGTLTATEKVADLGFTDPEKRFLGWKVYRESDKKWAVTDSSGNTSWATSLPSGGSYKLYGNGERVSQTAPAGSKVHFYAQWDNVVRFRIYYHDNDTAAAASTYTDVLYGQSTATKTASELGFDTSSRTFKGWKVYREYDKTWYVKDANGNASWAATVPVGGSYGLYSNGTTVASTAPVGTNVHFYGQWLDTVSFTVKYHLDDSSAASSKTTSVVYGTNTKTLTAAELGFAKNGQAFLGWKVYRPFDGTYRVKDASGNESWAAKVPEGGSYRLYGDGCSVASTVPIGTTVEFYGQWTENKFTVLYHKDESSAAESKVTVIDRSVGAQLTSVSDLGFTGTRTVFAGWKATREKDGTWLINSDTGRKWGTPSSDDELCLLKDKEKLVTTTGAGDVIHLYGVWIDTDLDVTDPRFGAVANDSKDDAPAIQKALDMAGTGTAHITVNIPAGKYHLGTALKIYSETTLNVSDDAVIIRDDDSNNMLTNAYLGDKAKGGYLDLKNVEIKGGVWDGNVTSFEADGGGSYAKDIFFLYHGENITVSDMTMKGCCGYHFIEFVSIKNGRAENITFRDYVRLSPALSANSDEPPYISEAIQLDLAAEDGADGAFPLDDTVCTGFTVTKCNFINCLSGVGNHHIGRSYTSDVTITDNYFKSLDGYCITLYGFNNAVIENNTAEDIHAFLICDSSDDSRAQGNNVSYGYSLDELTLDLIYVKNSSLELISNTFSGSERMMIFCTDSDMTMTDNTFIYPEDNSIKENAVYLRRSSMKLTGNTINNAGWAAIRIADNSTGTVTDNVIDSTGTTGISLTDSSISEISSNRLRSVGSNSIQLDNSSASIKSNNISNSGTNGIYLKSASNAVITKNDISDSGQNGMYVSESTFDITGNTIKGSKNASITAVGTADNLSGTISGNELYGKSINVPAYITVKNNTEHDVATAFTIKYYKTTASEASDMTSEVTYGVAQKSLTTTELGFTQSGKTFKGWICFRDYDNKWYVKDANGKAYWAAAVPTGGSYYYYKNGESVGKTTVAGTTAYFYGVWE